jgi:hypothetical protein
MKIWLLAAMACVFVSQASFARAKPAMQKGFEELVATSGKNRSPGTEGAKKALEWLKAKAQAIGGWEVEEQVFSPDTDFAVAS